MKKIIASAFILSLLAGCKKEFAENAINADISDMQENRAVMGSGSSNENHMPNELIVKFKAGSAESSRRNALMRVAGSIQEHILTKAMERAGDREGIYLVHTPLAVAEAIAKMKGIEIEFAEPNFIYTHDAVANETYYSNGSLWGMYGNATSPANDFGSQAGEAWAANHTGSSSVVVGIIDEGVMHSHQDLAGNIWTNPGEIAGNGVDDDGNGYKDDVYGWDFDRNDNSTYDGTSDDHGTHVAGTIGARGGNGLGVAGVCWNVKMITAKFLGRRGGTTANAVKALDYLTDLKSRHGIDLVATNNSWGGGGFSQSLQDAITRSGNADILFIAAAGNGGGDGVGDNNDVTASYPSNYNNATIIAVASITKTGGLSSFSNYGASTVDLGAPGSAILSTVPGKNGSSGYKSYSGTSMATPHVTGAVALWAASNSGRGLAIKSAITGSTIATTSLSGKTSTGGRLNAGGF